MESVSFAQVGAFIACLIVLLGVAVGIKSLFARTPPLHREYVSKDLHAKLEKRVDDIEALIREGFEKIDLKRSVSVAGIYEEMRSMNTRLAVTSEKANLTYTHMQAIDTKMDLVLQKLPR